MIRWANEPPRDDSLPHLPLKRVGQKGLIQGALTCTKILGVYTHFLGRRTLPCTTDQCPGCNANLPKRYEAYISLWTLKPSTHIILALTPRAARELEGSVPNPNDIRGTLITVQRLGNRPNGALTCRVEHTQELTGKLPPIPELTAHMMKIWGLDQAQISQDHPMYAASTDAPENWEAKDHG